MVRTLTGHNSNCMSVDFHPYSKFFASGSLDTSLRVWDIRNKGCVHKYSGHPSGISRCRFSPDGRWVASAGDDGTVKLWDLTADKLLKTFTKHEAAVPVLEFHPNEFLLATASMDHAVRFWDLETFELIGNGRSESSGIRAGTFDPEGRAFLTATAEHLRAWHWELSESFDAVDVHWNKVADVSTHNNKLLGASTTSSFLALWVVDLAQMLPCSSHPPNSQVEEHQLRLQPHSTEQHQQQRLQDSQERLQNLHASQRTSQHLHADSRAFEQPHKSRVGYHFERDDGSNDAVEASQCQPPEPTKPTAGDHRAASHPTVMPHSREATPESSRAQALHEEGPLEGKVNAATEMGDTLLRGYFSPEDMQRAAQAAETAERYSRLHENVATPSKEDNALVSEGRGSQHPGGESMQAQSQQDDHIDGEGSDALQSIFTRHKCLLQSLTTRLSTMQIIQRFWEQSDFKRAAEALEDAKDDALAAELFEAIDDGTSDGYTLEACAQLLPCVKRTLQSSIERHRAAAASVAYTMAQKFAPLVRSTLSASPDRADLAQEERIERCRAAFEGFVALRSPLMEVKSESTSASGSARSALDIIEQLSQRQPR